MKASVVREFGGGFQVEDVEIASPVGKEVLVEVKASGLCHSDLTFMQTNVGMPLPLVFGHEVSGVVTEVGPLVSTIKVGDHVAGSLIQFCGECVRCLSGKTHQCLYGNALLRTPDQAPRLTAYGEPLTQAYGMGGFAQQVLIHENQLAVIPSQMPFPQAALLGCAVLTGAGAVLNTAQVAQGESVVIIGAGGVGLNAISGAVIAGAGKIIVVDIEDRKLERAQEFGATHVINSTQAKVASEVRKLTGGGADHIFDFVGKRAITDEAKKMVAKGGAIYLVGMVDPDAGIDISTFWGMNMQVRVEVVTMGSSNLKRDIPFYADLYLQGRFKLDELISKEISLSEINEGYEALHDGFTARVVVTDLA